MKGCVLLFPGIRYTVDMPLLYYPGLYYRDKGYEVIPVSYGSQFDKVEFHNQDITQEIENAQNYCIEQIRKIDFSAYDEVIFVSKSLGTAVAGWIAKQLDISCQQIYLTPIAQTLPFMKSGCLAIAGDADKVLEPKVLKDYCSKHAIDLHVFAGGHRIEVKDDVQKNLKTLESIMALLR